MSAESKPSKSSVAYWLAGISMAILAVMESVEPFLFEDEKFTFWRITKICILVIMFLQTVLACKKKYA